MGSPPPIQTPESRLPRLYRFGVFEVDPRSGELRKNGYKVRIQEQPFQILLMLLERPGDVVTRDDMRQRLWSETFVDFDHGLNTAINKLRDALGDTATNPRFVETLARRGYRFIAPVQKIELPGAESSAAESAAEGNRAASESATPAGPAGPEPGATTTLTEAQGASSASQAAAETPEEDELPRPARAVSRLLFGLVQVMYLVFYVVALVRLQVINNIVSSWRPAWTSPVVVLVLVTAPVGIAIRLYLLTAVAFDFKALGRKFRRLFPVVLPLDQLWALAPFLALPDIGVGAAFAVCAALLYLPFSERTLIRMGYQYNRLTQ